MTLDLDDTIVAIASAPGGGLRGIVRLSGPASAACVASVFRPANLALQTETCTRGHVHLPRQLGDLPATLYLWPNSRSYTRQPSAELHVVGSPPVLEAVVESLCQAAARLARPGEFTLRAFLAGRLDLTQAEAVLGVIEARGAAQLQTALAQLAGGLAVPLAALREKLLDLLAHLEAGLDFVEEDIEFVTAAELERQLAGAAGAVQQVIERMHSRRDTSELARVVLVGPPNAGKSSLVNALAGRDAAIVSEVAGTTRDYVACRLSALGQEFLLIDTAGTAGAPELVDGSLAAAAQAITANQRQAADVTIYCCDASDPGAIHAARHTQAPYACDLLVWTKCDLSSPPGSSAIRTSSKTGQGVDQLRGAIAAVLCEQSADAVVASTAARCGESLELARAALSRAQALAASRAGEELIAAELHSALDGLGLVAGVVYTEDVLDRVFSRFCNAAPTAAALENSRLLITQIKPSTLPVEANRGVPA